jgi:hypothetical protein
MKKRRTVFALLMLTLIPACAPEPFQRPPLPPLNTADPNYIRESFARAIPPRFTSDDTVIIYAPFHHDMAILGVLHVDRPAGSFELVGLNQLGVELFDLYGDSHGNFIRSAIPPLMRQKEVLLAIAADIRRMFLDLVPAIDAKIDATSTTIRFTQNTNDGDLIYEFGGSPVVLLEKRLEGWFGWHWRVRYYDYVVSAGTLYPRGIVMDNGRYHYRVIVKNRDLTAK